MSKSKGPIEIKKPDLRIIQIDVFGNSPLICHRWSEKAKKEMLDKHMGKPTVKTFKNPQKDFEDSLYVLPAGAAFEDATGFGFPAVAFKAAAVRAGKMAGLVMTDLRQMFFVLADEDDCVRIEGEPTMREDMVRLNKNMPDIRYRGEFREWSCKLNIQYNAGVISDEQLVNLFQMAGFSVGVGEWRPEKSGNFGCFSLIKESAKKTA
jgi:hypothetical protein